MTDSRQKKNSAKSAGKSQGKKTTVKPGIPKKDPAVKKGSEKNKTTPSSRNNKTAASKTRYGQTDQRHNSEMTRSVLLDMDLRTKKILESRARELAEIPVYDVFHAESTEVVEFVLSYEHYGIESLYVQEVTSMKEFTPIPGTPPFVMGIINVRGHIVSIIDIRKYFSLPSSGLSDLNRVIIVEHGPMEMGILADSIAGVRMLTKEQIHHSLPTLNDARAEYIKGVTAEGLILLDMDKLLSDSKLIVYEEVE